MKREILFRGKRKADSKWVYGDLSQPTDVHSFIRQKAVNGETHYVGPKTVGQYTGLKDKNGVKIFEGDIVEFKANYSSNPCGWMNAKVVISEYRLELHSNNGFVYDAQEETDEFPHAHCKVIGNIHDNSELT